MRDNPRASGASRVCHGGRRLVSALCLAKDMRKVKKEPPAVIGVGKERARRRGQRCRSVGSIAQGGEKRKWENAGWRGFFVLGEVVVGRRLVLV